MKANRVAIYSCEGFSREVLPILKRANAELDVVFVDDAPDWQGRQVNGIDVISFDTLSSSSHKDRKIVVGIANPLIRKQIADKCLQQGFAFLNVFDETFVHYDQVSIGIGAVFCRNSMITSNVEIGAHFHCNIYSYIAHDCKIGDFVTFGPRVSCNGRVIVEDGAYIGAGAVIKQGTKEKPLRIGRAAVVGMGAIVTKDVPPNTTVIGNPAIPMKKI